MLTYFGNPRSDGYPMGFQVFHFYFGSFLGITDFQISGRLSLVEPLRYTKISWKSTNCQSSGSLSHSNFMVSTAWGIWPVIWGWPRDVAFISSTRLPMVAAKAGGYTLRSLPDHHNGIIHVYFGDGIVYIPFVWYFLWTIRSQLKSIYIFIQIHIRFDMFKSSRAALWISNVLFPCSEASRYHPCIWHMSLSSGFSTNQTSGAFPCPNSQSLVCFHMQNAFWRLRYCNASSTNGPRWPGRHGILYKSKLVQIGISIMIWYALAGSTYSMYMVHPEIITVYMQPII